MKPFRALFVLALIAVASPLFAINIVRNPSFNGNLNFWLSGGATFDATKDATGVPGSGSARSATSFGGNTIAISQCIAAVPGNYTLSGKVFIPSGQAITGTGNIGVTWFGGSNCSGGPILGSTIAVVSATGSFVTVSRSTVAPAGTTFAFVTGQHITSGGSTHVVNFDDIDLDDGVPTPLPMLGPVALLLLIVMLAAVGAVALRR